MSVRCVVACDVQEKGKAGGRLMHLRMDTDVQQQQ